MPYIASHTTSFKMTKTISYDNKGFIIVTIQTANPNWGDRILIKEGPTKEGSQMRKGEIIKNW